MIAWDHASIEARRAYDDLVMRHPTQRSRIDARVRLLTGGTFDDDALLGAIEAIDLLEDERPDEVPVTIGPRRTARLGWALALAAGLVLGFSLGRALPDDAVHDRGGGAPIDPAERVTLLTTTGPVEARVGTGVRPSIPRAPFVVAPPVSTGWLVWVQRRDHTIRVLARGAPDRLSVTPGSDDVTLLVAVGPAAVRIPESALVAYEGGRHVGGPILADIPVLHFDLEGAEAPR